MQIGLSVDAQPLLQLPGQLTAASQPSEPLPPLQSIAHEHALEQSMALWQAFLAPPQVTSHLPVPQVTVSSHA